MQPYTIQHKPELLLLIHCYCDLWYSQKIRLCFLGSHVSLVVPIPSPLPLGPRYFLRPNPRPPGRAPDHVTPHGASQEAAFNWAAPGWHLIRAQERIKGTMLFFLCELDSGFRLQMRRMAWRTGVHLIPWLYPSKHLNIWRLQAGVRFLFGRSFAVDSLLFL